MKVLAVPLNSFVDGQQKVVLGLPMYRQVSTRWLFNWWQMDLSPCVGLVAVEGVRLPIAMTRIVGTAARVFAAWEWLVVFEDDIIPPPDALLRVAAYGEDVDIVGALNFQHDAPHHVNAMLRGGTEANPVYRPVPSATLVDMINAPGLHRVDAVAMGFTAIRRRVFTRWRPNVPMWQPIPPMQGQDIHFCHEAGRQGRSVWLDTSMRCGHLTEMAVGVADAQRYLPEPER